MRPPSWSNGDALTYLDAFFVVFLAIIVAMVVSVVAAGRVSIEQRQRHHEVGSPVFNQVGVMFSILLAFVFSDVWGEYNTAAQAISDECGAIHGAAMLADALPAHEGAAVVGAMQRYTQEVAGREWRNMGERRRSPQAVADTAAMLDQAARLDSADPLYRGVKLQIVSMLATAHAARETRIFQMNQALPPFLWSMLIALSVILVLFVAFSGLERAGRLLFVAVFAGSIALVLVVVRMLDYPFEGALALQATDFQILLGELDVLAGAGRA